jgi:hypothetical protein
MQYPPPPKKKKKHWEDLNSKHECLTYTYIAIRKVGVTLILFKGSLRKYCIIVYGFMSSTIGMTTDIFERVYSVTKLDPTWAITWIAQQN